MPHMMGRFSKVFFNSTVLVSIEQLMQFLCKMNANHFIGGICIAESRTMRLIKRNMWKSCGLTIVFVSLFLVTWALQFATGFHAYNEERIEKNQPTISAAEYARSGHFVSSTGENWESEFFQMALFVWLTAFLYQKGSAESNKLPEEKTAQDLVEDSAENQFCIESRKKHPLWFFYERSLTIVLFILFIISFFIHSWGSFLMINEEKLDVFQPPIPYWQVFQENQFWFESFQNWQSEFLSIAAIVVLSIFLRHKNSAQSKKMNIPNLRTEG